MNAKEMAEQTKQQLLSVSEALGSRRAAAERLSSDDLSISWLLKFMNGEISNPTVESLAALQSALAELPEVAA